VASDDDIDLPALGSMALTSSSRSARRRTREARVDPVGHAFTLQQELVEHWIRKALSIASEELAGELEALGYSVGDDYPDDTDESRSCTCTYCAKQRL
jgi:hypothetical protein